MSKNLEIVSIKTSLGRTLKPWSRRDHISLAYGLVEQERLTSFQTSDGRSHTVPPGIGDLSIAAARALVIDRDARKAAKPAPKPAARPPTKPPARPAPRTVRQHTTKPAAFKPPKPPAYVGQFVNAFGNDARFAEARSVLDGAPLAAIGQLPVKRMAGTLAGSFIRSGGLGESGGTKALLDEQPILARLWCASLLDAGREAVAALEPERQRSFGAAYAAIGRDRRTSFEIALEMPLAQLADLKSALEALDKRGELGTGTKLIAANIRNAWASKNARGGI